MNSRKIRAAIAVLACFLLSPVGAARAEEKIDSFDVEMRIRADASVEITESIRYDFGGGEKHGIYRYIPVRYAARGGNYSTRMREINVTDENGKAYAFTVADSGDNKEIRIGRADEFVSGVRTYVLHYRMEGVINYFDTYDEFYWNVTGNGFLVPVGKASATVRYPRDLGQEEASLACYVGGYGSQAACASTQYLPSGGEGRAAGASFTAQDLLPQQGLTVVVGMPKGMVSPPTRTEILRNTLSDNLILLLPFLTFLLAYYVWRKRGKDPAGRGTIVTEFDVPEQVTPAEAGTIADENCGQKELTAEIIQLGVKGYLRIKREEKKVLLIESVDYIFERLRAADESLSEHEKTVLSGIFGQKDRAALSEFKTTFYPTYRAFTKEVYGAVSRKGYFAGNPQATQTKYFALYFVFLVLAFVLIMVLTGSTPGGYAALSFIVSLAVAGVFAYHMPRKTKTGVLLREKILGLKEYLRVAEKDRLKFHNAPEKSPEQFEKLLPYAIVLGVEKDWARQFEGILHANPSWYDDPRGLNDFTALYFVSNLGDFSNDFRIAAAAASGSSGMGGGGFSGGGFGGGGGGSW